MGKMGSGGGSGGGGGGMMDPGSMMASMAMGTVNLLSLPCCQEKHLL